MTVVLFSGRHSLNDELLRSSLIRIPEVLTEIKRAQKVLDQENIALDLFEQMSLPAEDFCRKLAARAALTVLVQVGMYNRWRKKGIQEIAHICREGYATPETLFNPDMTAEEFKKWILEVFAQGNVLAFRADISEIPFENFAYFEGTKKQFSSNCLEVLLREAFKLKPAQRIISLDPGKAFLTPEIRTLLEENNVDVLDIFEVDPALSWFWPSQQARRVGQN